MSDSPIREALTALSRFFVGDGTVEQTLSKVTHLVTEAVPSAELAGITVRVGGKHRTAVFTDPTVLEVDAEQYETGEGPCVHAATYGEVAVVESTQGAGPYAEFRRAARHHGITSTLSLPLVIDTTPLGAMNLYARNDRGFDERQRSTGEIYAIQAAIVLANSQAYWDARESSTGLAQAMRNRAVIEQAKGMIMAAQGMDEDQAFEVLTRASQRENRKLRDIAKRMVDDAVARGRAPSPAAGPTSGS